MLVIEISLGTLDTSRGQSTIAPAGLLSLQASCRSTPIATTALSFVVGVGFEGAVSVRLVPHARFRRDIKDMTG
jgi:hypothetical protein